MSTRPETVQPLHRWSINDSAETYAIERWGRGHFSINQAGHVVVASDKANTPDVDLLRVVEDLRFSDILRSRIEELNNSFAGAISECEYQGHYRGRPDRGMSWGYDPAG